MGHRDGVGFGTEASCKLHETSSSAQETSEALFMDRCAVFGSRYGVDGVAVSEALLVLEGCRRPQSFAFYFRGLRKLEPSYIYIGSLGLQSCYSLVANLRIGLSDFSTQGMWM